MKTPNSIAVTLMLLTLSACVKDKFDSPPTDGEDPKGITANTSIATLKTLYTIGSVVPVEITDDWVICGVVNGDDKSGNLYKTISIQDSTGGIQVAVDNSFLYNDYPTGRRIFIKCKGLFLGEYAGMVQLGGYIDNSESRPQLGGINSVVVQEKILKGKWNQDVKALDIPIAALNNITHQSMLIKLTDVEFTCGNIFQPYADAEHLAAFNRTIQDCSGNRIIVRTSGYANFATELTPAGRGSVTALYTIYKSSSSTTPQLVLRNTNDIELTDNTRCDGTVINNAGLISIKDLRAVYTGSATPAPCANKIRGVVISDKSSGNFDPRNAMIQDGTGGITVRFAANHSLFVGDSVEISTSGTEISEYRKNLQLNNTPLINITKLSVTTPVPVIVNIADISANFERYESALVKIPNVVLSGNSSSYGGSLTMNDGTGTLTLYTSYDANFASSYYLTGQRTVVGILQQYNDIYELLLRTSADVY